MLMMRSEVEKNLMGLISHFNAKRKIKERIISKFVKNGFAEGDINAIFTGTKSISELSDNMLGAFIVQAYGEIEDNHYKYKINPTTIFTEKELDIIKKLKSNVKDKNNKERFLYDLDLMDSTRKTYLYILNKASRMEEQLNKDICDFTDKESEQLLLSFSRKSIQVVFVVVSCFRSYVTYCISHGFRKYIQGESNWWNTINSQVHLNQYVDKIALNNRYVDLDTLREFQATLVNAQDIAVLELLFIGVKGKEASELLNLKAIDVQEDKIILPNRVIKISQETYTILKDAIDEEYYELANGEGVVNKRYTHGILQKTPFILRPIGSKKQYLTKCALYGRMERYRTFLDNPYMNMNSLWQSGMLHLLKEIKNEKGELTTQDYKYVNTIFGYDEIYWFQTKMRFIDFL
jgi:hypothetical protein